MNLSRSTKLGLVRELRRLRKSKSVLDKLIESHCKVVWDLQERVKELNCLYGISRLMQHEALSFDSLILKIAELIRESWQYPEITCSRVVLLGRKYESANFRESGHIQSSPITLCGERLGEVQIGYLEARPACDEGPFLKEERHLLDAIAEQLSRMVMAKRSQEQMKLLSVELIKAQENERQRVARELHDNLAQNLIMLKLELAGLGDPAKDGGLKAKLDGLGEDVGRQISAVRDMAYDLMPPGLSELGLDAALFRYCEDFALRRGLEVDFHCAGLEPLKLDFETRINLFRIVQEALANALRHSGASLVRVRLIGSYPSVILRVEDDGKGFNVEKCLAETYTQKKMGLWGMRERARSLDGKLSVKSSPGKGTKIIVEAPASGCRK